MSALVFDLEVTIPSLRHQTEKTEKTVKKRRTTEQRKKYLTEMEKVFLRDNSLKIFVGEQLKELWAKGVGCNIASGEMRAKGVPYCSLHSVKRYYRIFYECLEITKKTTTIESSNTIEL